MSNAVGNSTRTRKRGGIIPTPAATSAGVALPHKRKRRKSKAKIAAGVVVFGSSFSLLTQGSVFEFIVGVVIAVGLAAWGLVPYLKAKKTKEG